VTTYNQDFAGGAGALGAPDGVIQIQTVQTLNRNGSGVGILSGGGVSMPDIDVVITGSYGADQTSRITVTALVTSSHNVLARITGVSAPGDPANNYKAYVDAISVGSYGELVIGKTVAGVFNQLGSAITGISVPPGDDLWIKVAGNSPATIEVYKTHLGVDTLLGSRTDSSFSSGNPGFGMWWDSFGGSSPQIDNAVATDAMAPVLPSLQYNKTRPPLNQRAA
jgi:hypothetical protein